MLLIFLKVLKIKILDILKENIIYVFNFGISIIDNNEGNEFEYFKYVFLIGDYIDSLIVKGIVNDVLFLVLDKKIIVMFYEVFEIFKDFIIFLEKLIYIIIIKEK